MCEGEMRRRVYRCGLYDTLLAGGVAPSYEERGGERHGDEEGPPLYEGTANEEVRREGEGGD